VKNRSRRALTIVETTVVAAIVLSLGILLMYFAADWAQGSMLDLTEETDINIEALRSALVIEAINYNPELETVNLTIRNISKFNISLTVYRIELRSAEDDELFSAVDLPPTEDYTISQGEVLEVQAPTCGDASSQELAQECLQTDKLLYRAYYIPSTLLEKGVLTSRTILYIDSGFVNPFLTLPPPRCPLPDQWAIIDIVDPVTYIQNGRIASYQGRGKVWVRAPLASHNTTIELDILVEEIRQSGNAKSGSGSEDIAVPSPNEYEVFGDYSTLGTPFRITITSPDVQVIPREWVFAGKLDPSGMAHVHVSGIVLFWKTEDRTINNVMLEMGADRQGDYIVRIRFIDCTGAVLGESSRDIHFLPGTSTANLFLEIDPPVKLDQVYIVETEVEEA